MSHIKNFFLKIRNNWKKTVFGSTALAYGINFGNEKYAVNCLMREYCETAVKLGDAPISVTEKPRRITVILNPAANRRKAKSEFEEYCAPVLNLSGMIVNVQQTTSEGGARVLVENLSEETDALIVAGGDGTLSEVVTGLLRRFDGNVQQALKIPIGVLPLGRTNSVIKGLLKKERIELREEMLADAAMNIVNEKTKPLDLIRIDVLEPDSTKKPVYSLSSVEWGEMRNANFNRDKYWYFGSFRQYMAYLFYGSPKPIVETQLTYLPPCSGCNDCFESRPDLQPALEQPKKWWHYFIPVVSRKTSREMIDYTSILNPSCNEVSSKEVQSLNLEISTTNVNPPEMAETLDTPHLNVNIDESELSYFDFVKKGFDRIKGKNPSGKESLQVRNLELIPAVKDEKEAWLSIDNEEYEVKPIRLTLLPKSINVFCS